MDSDVQAAWIAAAASMVVAVLSALIAIYSALRVERFRAEHEKALRLEDRAIAARQQLDRYRDPLRDAAHDLAHRIGNIGRGEQSVLTYLDSEDDRRRDLAMWGTCYRFASYWGVVEALYRDVSELRFANDSSTKAVSDLLDEVGSSFAGDSKGTELMMWREEQRAIGELMHVAVSPGALVRVIGFSSFVEHYDDDFAVWFEQFARDLHDPATWQHPRLADVRDSLVRLETALSPERT
jgi:hypothetical protein